MCSQNTTSNFGLNWGCILQFLSSEFLQFKKNKFEISLNVLSTYLMLESYIYTLYYSVPKLVTEATSNFENFLSCLLQELKLSY